jgi:putative endonuclease
MAGLVPAIHVLLLSPHEGRLGILHDQSAQWRSLLVYYEQFDDIRDAIQREKTIKHCPRAWKVRLIHSMNPEWNDLYDSLA